jgi:hypothetical protein
MKYLFVLTALFFVSCAVDSQQPVATRPATIRPKPNLVLLSQRIERVDETMIGIHGEVRNTGTTAIEHTSLTVAAYDRKGNIIRTDPGVTNPMVIKPGQTATFSIFLLDAPGFHSHKITAVIDSESFSLYP